MAEHSPQEHSLPFENIVFEGGGAKGFSYNGVLQVLDEEGVYTKFKRFAGVSMGSVFATLMAIGNSPQQIREFTTKLNANVFLDGFAITLALNLFGFKRYGIHPAKRFQKLLANEINMKTGDSHLTFGKLYKKQGKELCIVASNVSSGNVEYFHPKTTPNFSIIQAVAKSVAVPGILKPPFSELNGRGEYFIDGGLLNNFPINCYDGWYLSMDPKNSFLHKENIGEMASGWFDGFNDKTLGAILFSTSEREVFQIHFEKRLQDYCVKRPDTSLCRKRLPYIKNINEVHQKQKEIKMAVHHFLAYLRHSEIDLSENITKEDFVRCLSDFGVGTEEYNILFGNRTPPKVFDDIDRENDNFISVHELVPYFSSRGVPIHHGISSRPSHEIDNVMNFVQSVIESQTARQKRLTVKKRDLLRCIGINCDYVTALDELEPPDIDFLCQQGRNATEAFLKEYRSQSESSGFSQ